MSSTHTLDEAEAEFSLMWGLLTMGSHDYVDRVRKHVKLGDFGTPEYNDLYTGVCALRDEGTEQNPIDLAEWLESNPRHTRRPWEGTVALRYMNTIILDHMPPGAAMPEPLAKRVHRLAQERQVRNAMLQAAQETGESFRNACWTVRSVMDEIEQEQSKSVKSAWHGVEGWKDDQIQIAGGDLVRTGWDAVDQRLGPIRKGELVTLAARSGVGKTFACLTICENILVSNPLGSVLLIEQEMAASEVGGRIAAGVLETNPTRMNHEIVSVEQLREFAPYFNRLHVCDRSVSIGEIPGMIREASVTGPCRAVIIDYLDLLIDQTNARTVYERVSNQIVALKRLARQQNLVVICVCQLNRRAEWGETEPEMHMLRDSGKIEENSDRVLLMWREPGGLDIRVKIGKNRFGVVGFKSTLTFTSGMRLVEITPTGGQVCS